MISGGKFAQFVFEKGSGHLKIGNNFLIQFFKRKIICIASKYILLLFFLTFVEGKP